MGMLNVDSAESMVLSPENPLDMNNEHLLADITGNDEVRFFGRYRILRHLGRGGMGDVFLAEQDKPKRTVALKAIRPEMGSDSIRRRFEREMDVFGRLTHPGIAQIYDAGVTDVGRGPQPFFAMEYVRGELSARL